MVSTITKIRLVNFKRFKNYTVIPNRRINIIVGDNEVGKSSILEAIDLVSNGNVRRVESIGLDRLINIDAVAEFNSERSKRTFDDLPKLIIELYLEGDNFDFTMNGKNNTEHTECDGIRLVCEPNDDYRSEITDVLSADSDYFPYDFYKIRFSTFADEGYSGYKKKIRSILIDSSTMNSEYATTEFVRRMYMRYTDQNVKERANHKSSYRKMRSTFQKNSLQKLNDQIVNDSHYTFGLKNGSAAEFESDLMIYEGNIGIDSKGTGKQIFIKTDFALERSGKNIDVILVEEPENHLSPTNLRKLIQRVSDTQNGQIFITTHNSLISTRLELKNLLIMHMNGTSGPISLKNLSDATAKYFMKTPPASIVEFALAKKVILVEGPAEYMLMERFFEECTGRTPESDDIHIIDVRGLSFKRYLDIAKLSGCKVAVITDNDGDYQKHCVDKYKDYKLDDNIQIFYEKDIDKRTFEVVLYKDNLELCDKLFDTSNTLEYMLNNKTEAAYELLSQNDTIKVPKYIREGIEWIRK